MPYDSVYSEKRPPGTLRTAWRKFYSDASAMVGLYGCAGRCPVMAARGWPYVYFIPVDQPSAINYCRRHGRAMAKFLSSWGLTTSDAMF